MRIILDESVPQKLRLLIDSRHTVLSTNNWSVIRDRVAEIAAAIDAATSGSFAFVDIGYGRG